MERKCKNCAHKVWARGWRCSNDNSQKCQRDEDSAILMNFNDVCPFYEESYNKIYVAIFNYYGSAKELAARYPGAELVNGNTLCFCNVTGEWVSRQMERDGCDYNYSYVSAEDAWRKEVYE